MVRGCHLGRIFTPNSTATNQKHWHVWLINQSEGRIDREEMCPLFSSAYFFQFYPRAEERAIG